MFGDNAEQFDTWPWVGDIKISRSDNVPTPGQ